MIWEGVLQEKLEALGVQVRIAHFTGDSSYPTEFTLTHGDVQAGGPTLDLAMVDFIEKLLASDTVKAYHAIETALQLLTGQILNLRTEILVIKELAAKEEVS